jgi:hypothetical protein
MRRLFACGVVAVAIWPATVSLAAAETVRATIIVRIYQTAGLSPAVEDRALTEADRILRAGFVDVKWRKCLALDRQRAGACDSSLGQSERTLRIVRRGGAGDDARAALGDAIVERSAGGVLATVYFDRVATLANTAHTDVAIVLGRTIAHEIAHLLMRTAAHSQCGVMRPRWTPREIRRNSTRDWSFTVGDILAMYERGLR